MCDGCRWRIRQQLREESGTTLVELIVTFALIGLFMTAATAMLTSSLQMFGRMQATASAVNVSDLILDKVVGEIVAADIPEKNSPAGSGYYFWLEPSEDEESHWVVFRNRSQSPIAIFAGESGNAPQEEMGKGQLFIKYYAVSRKDQKAVEEIDWHFDKNVYMGYKITDLHFKREDKANHKNVVTIFLTIENERTGFVYSSKRYAECYNYDNMYMSERDDTKTNFPADLKDGETGAKEFEIKAPTGGGDSGEDKENEFTVYYKSSYTGNEISERTVIQAKYGDKLTLTAKSIDGYQLADDSTGNVLVEYTKDKKEHVFTYIPFVYNYRIVFFKQGLRDREQDLDVIQGKIHTDEKIINSVHPDIWDRYAIEEKDYDGVVVKDGKWELSAARVGNPTQYEAEIPCYPLVTYKVFYKCGDVLLKDEPDIRNGKLGEIVKLIPESFSGYTPLEESYYLSLNEEKEFQYTFQYKAIGGGSAPFPPAGPNIEIEIEGKHSSKREPTDFENRIAQDIFDFFHGGWTNIEVSGKEHLTGAYKVFFSNGKKYAVAGGTNKEDFEKPLQEKLYSEERIDKENIIEIKKDDISSEADRKVFLEYILRNAGASEEYIKGIHGIEIEFDKDDNPKRLEEVTFKNADGEEIEIKYKAK